MKDDFAIHNLFWRSIKEYEQLDPYLIKLVGLPLVYQSPLIEKIPVLTPGIYILTGGRQVGKSTLLKMIIKRLLRQSKIAPTHIYYLPCDTIKDFSQLLFEIEQFRQSLDEEKPFMLFLDEITYVAEWPRAIKSLADAGFFRRGSVLITGSDSCLLKDAMKSFPGRRGTADEQDFHLYPLSFFEYITLTERPLCSKFEQARAKFQESLRLPAIPLSFDAISRLQKHFNSYLFTGGYLLAINDLARTKTIANAVYKTYTQWIVGDLLKRGKNEQSLKEIVRALFPRLSKQVSWHSFINSVSIEHHQTIIDYLDILCRMDVAVVLPALREDKMRAFPKKAKKICFSDPFIFHALRGWINKEKAIFNLSRELLRSPSELQNALIEGAIAALFHRRGETYYIKAEGEVDLAVVFQKGFMPVEIKNSLMLNKKELKQILKYNFGCVGYAGSEIGQLEHLQVLPIPLLAYVAA